MNNSLIIAIALAVCSACSASPHREVVHAPAGADPIPAELPLPTIPAELRTPQERADYLAVHFWDKMDFADTRLSLDTAFMEQNFVNFIDLLPHATPGGAEAAVERLTSSVAATDSTVTAFIFDIATRYLSDPLSPMRNEELHILFLRQETLLPAVGEAARDRAAFMLGEALKNRPGTIPADFTYVTPTGRSTLLTTPVGTPTLSTGQTDATSLLLMLYDPDCIHCKEITASLASDPVVNAAIDNGSLTVLAVAVDGSRSRWEAHLPQMPSNWINGYDTTGIEEKELYPLPAIPVFYLLGPDHRVIAKDPPASVIPSLLDGTAR